jgi:flagellin
MIQEEIGQLTREIGASIGRVEFNGQTLLNQGADLHTASAADGSGMTVRINDMTSLAQAVANFNVAGEGNLTTPDGDMASLPRADMNFTTADVDALLQEVNRERANLGAMENRLDHTMQANMISSENLSDSRSRVRDADMALEMMAVNQERVINEMQVLLQVQQQNNIQEQGRRMVNAVAGA